MTGRDKYSCTIRGQGDDSYHRMAYEIRVNSPCLYQTPTKVTVDLKPQAFYFNRNQNMKNNILNQKTSK